MILSGQSIEALCNGSAPMVFPFNLRTAAHGLTFGVGPAGYDVRIAEMVFIPPSGFLLASTVERFHMPDDVLGIVHDKSTWARRGLALQNTVIEPGWRGYLTIELSNHGLEPLTVRGGAPIAQIIFHRLDRETDAPYRGKYQDQAKGPQDAIIE